MSLVVRGLDGSARSVPFVEDFWERERDEMCHVGRGEQRGQCVLVSNLPTCLEPSLSSGTY